ncbi:hypothetical protein ACJMK2_028126 [Sinanodonta woodiana]|uniref:RING-type domain-containing protein n=1 Tax=Sinanodonta woodiana TaxID=1069815 RepID=A0ABD3X7M0_SINWO
MSHRYQESPQSVISLQDAIAHMIRNPSDSITNQSLEAGNLSQSEENYDILRDEPQSRSYSEGQYQQGRNDTDEQQPSRRDDMQERNRSENRDEGHQHSLEQQERIGNGLAENEDTSATNDDLETDFADIESNSDLTFRCWKSELDYDNCLCPRMLHEHTNISRDTKPSVLDADCAQSVLQTGFSDVAVVRAINDLLKEGKEEFGAHDILTVILDKEQEGTMPRQAEQSVFATSRGMNVQQNEAAILILQENLRLKRQIMCTECGKHKSNVLFLPCRHHTVCENCSAHIYVCFSCFRRIRQKIKTYMT